MRTRLFSILVALPLFLLFCFWGGGLFLMGIALLAVLAAQEWVRAYRSVGPSQGVGRWLNPLLVSNSFLFPILAWQMGRHPTPFSLLYAGGLACLVVGCMALTWRAAKTGVALGGLREMYGLVGMGYIGALLSGLVLLREMPGRAQVAPFGEADRGAWLLLLVAVSVWATDTLAYLVGRQFGKHPLAPTLSPKKTVEGSAGGVLGGVLAGMAFGSWIGLPLWLGLAVGALAGVVGQVGDLFESALKRELGLKDFGQIMPGHGGILDRFDSLLFVAPLAYLLLR